MTVKLRPYQEEAIKEILKYAKEQSVAFQAPTGSGKTLIALGVSRELGDASVYTRTLSQYYPWERDLKKLDLSVGGLAGKDRFCLKPKASGSDLRITQCRLCPFFSLKYSSKALNEKGVVGFLGSLRAHQKCGYSWMKYHEADVYLYTYPYYFFYRGLVKGNSLHIFDEAHNLMHIQELVGVSITLETIQKLRKEYAGTDVQADVYPALDALERWALEGAREGIPPPDLGQFGVDSIEDHNLSSFKRALDELGEPYYRVYLEKDGVSVKLVDPAVLLSKLNDERWLMLSGTLPSKTYMEKVWGLKNFKFIAINPYDFKLSFFWDRDLTTRYSQRSANRGDYVRAVSGLRSSEGITLVLVPSYEVASWFKGVADYVEDKTSTAQSVPETGIVVAVARGKLSEGVEFVKRGRSLVKRVVVVGIPYPNTSDDYTRDELKYLMNKMGKKTVWFMLREEASVIIRQAIGRAVRSEDDEAEVYFLDRRSAPFIKDMGIKLKEVKIMRSIGVKKGW